MKRWKRIRWALRTVSAVSAVVALSPLVSSTSPFLALVAGIVAAGAGGLAKDLPRDQWSPGERARVRAAVTPYKDEDTPADRPLPLRGK